MLHKISLYYFSPTGGTKKAGETFCQEMAGQVEVIDLGVPKQTVREPEGEVVVFAAPVFGGRIPKLVTDKIRKLHGNGKRAVTLAVYGTRAYEDALLELNRAVEGQGFQVAASAALIARHSIVPEVGAGRPDEKDQEEIRDFAKSVLEKLRTSFQGTVKVPGNDPYKEAMNMPATPISLPVCNQCKRCVSICPAEAISISDGMVTTDTEACILCMACTVACPQGARILPPPLQEQMNEKLGALKTVRRENEFYL